MKKKKENIIRDEITFLSPADMANTLTKDKYKLPKHILLLDSLLYKLSERKIRKLIINMPPRHGKSELISHYFPAWYLGTHKSHRIILTSYGSALATTFGRKAKNFISEYGKELFDIEINSASNSAARFDILKSAGGMDCVGALGALTGKGADLLIIDDPVKNDSQAHSIKMRNNLWEWFNATALTRLEPDGIVVVVMTRWHEDDLCGRILSNCKYMDYSKYMKDESLFDAEQWLLLRLPAIAESADAIGRKAGDALWSERFSIGKLNENKRAFGSYWFSSLYQQSPAPAGGGIFMKKFFRYFDEDEDFYFLIAKRESAASKKTISKQYCSLFVTTDLAVSLKDNADYTVIVVFAITPELDILILDVIREKFEGSSHTGLLEEIYDKWHPLQIGIESVQYQLSLIQTLRDKGLPVMALKADKSKQARALTMQSSVEGEKVFFRKKAPWLYEFEKELTMFPNASHDDQVDAFAYISFMKYNYSKSLPAGEKRNNRHVKGLTGNFGIV